MVYWGRENNIFIQEYASPQLRFFIQLEIVNELSGIRYHLPNEITFDPPPYKQNFFKNIYLSI